MSILQDLNEGLPLQRLVGASYDQVKNAFFANYLGGLVLLRLQDLRGLKLINDPSNAALRRFSPTMSDLNFWGRAMFYPNAPEVKSRLAAGQGALLATSAEKVLDSRILRTMQVPTQNPAQVNWNDALGALMLFRFRFGVRSSYFDHVVTSLYRWDKESTAAKKKTINDAFMYLMQSDPKSALLPRLRELSNTLMIKGLGGASMSVIGFSRISEDGGAAAGGGGGAASASSGATSTASIGSTSNAIVSGGQSCEPGTPAPGSDAAIRRALGGLYKLDKLSPNQVSKKKGRFTIRNGRLIKVKVKSFEPRLIKAPKPLKARKEKKNDVAKSLPKEART